ncbi:MAG: asparagine--tRNA ligase [Parachlamydiales bacterium]|nr:asparagine--tRNA ligase [Parachlamydiales bacterium]
MRTKINAILFPSNPEEILGKTVTVCGWLKTLRNQKNCTFLEINDGSCLQSLQAILEEGSIDLSQMEKLSTGASVALEGKIVPSPGHNQSYEMQVTHIHIYGTSPQDYPLQKKRHSFEFLRSIAHLRPRTNTQGAVARVRNCLAFATHEFFQRRGFYYVHTPIITASDCEGGGALFRVTTLEPGNKDFTKDFFQTPTYLTVSGQLNGEAFACALSDIYTFGPTFRAENSHTSRHLAEFWMIEPEMAFATLNDNKECAESYLKFMIQKTLRQCPEDIKFFDQFIEKGLLARLEHVLTTPFEHMSYTKAIAILEKSHQKFSYPVKWGMDLQSEHERYLTEEHCKKPVILTDYPKEIKAFYMRLNDDHKTVAAMDVLVPKIGEIIGGSQREEREEILEQRIVQLGFKKEDYGWYSELRKYGTVPHAGFGVGFERLVQFITGMENIRDVIPFPRYPGHADF